MGHFWGKTKGLIRKRNANEATTYPFTASIFQLKLCQNFTHFEFQWPPNPEISFAIVGSSGYVWKDLKVTNRGKDFFALIS